MTWLRSAPRRHSAFDGFDAYFSETIAPSLASLECERRTVARHCRIIIAIAAALFVITVWAAIAVFQSFAVAFVGFMFAGAVVVFGLNWRMEGIYTAINTALLGGMADYLELGHIGDATCPRSLEMFRKRGLVPKNNSVECGDIIEGVWRGVKFACSEAWLSQRARDRGGDRTVFAGQLFRIDLPSALPEPVTLIGRKERFRSWRKPHAGAINVTATEERLKPYFTVWGETASAAQVLATHGLVPKLVDLGQRYRDHKLRVWFWRERVYIAINNGDQLAAGSLFRPLHSQRRVQQAMLGFSRLLRTVEAFAP